MKTLISSSALVTRGYALKLAKKLKGDEVILLSGDLGSGKTEFIRGLARGLGIKSKITSPTFLLHKAYPFKKSKKVFFLNHFDLYRARKTTLTNLGLDEIVNMPNQITAIEWPNKIKALKKFLSGKLISITFEYGEKANSRKLKISD